MSTQHNDSFLPSGAINMPMPSHEIPHCLSDPQTTVSMYQDLHGHSYTTGQNMVLSSPKTCSESAENSNIMQVEDWSTFVQRLRNQFKGERAHLRADQDRMQELIERERELWDYERKLWNIERKALRTRIIDLETRLYSVTKSSVNQVPTPLHLKIPKTNLNNSIGSIVSKIPQESGRNADGSPFYAPAPRNPTRKFDSKIASDARLVDVTDPREISIRLSSKEFTASDFLEQLSPSLTVASDHEIVGDTIDISHIQPELDGIAIRVSAISPTFTAKVLLTHTSPPCANSRPETTADTFKKTTIRSDKMLCQESRDVALFSQQENKRLTLFAGHTPNYSMGKFDHLEGASETSSHIKSSDKEYQPSDILEDQESYELCIEKNYDGEERLSEPLGLTNVSGPDNSFLSQLTEKLAQEVRKGEDPPSFRESEPIPIDLSGSPHLSCNHNEGDVEAPILKMKLSMNFGRPLGTI